MFSLNCKGKLLVLKQPVAMGIINITADSFYEGHISKTTDDIVIMAESMIVDGASILDIGGQSTRPGSQRISAEEEADRVLPVINALHHNFPDILLSVDTYHAEVASRAVSAGASIINDVSSGNMDKAMIATAASLRVPYIAMHMQGTPETMQQHPAYTDVVKEVLDFFINKLDECAIAGINDILIDVGFGFGKDTQHNFTLLKNLKIFKMLNRPIVAGLSRKGMIYRTLKTSAAEALNGTTALNMIALQNGANILRVHDVKEAMECIRLHSELSQA